MKVGLSLLFVTLISTSVLTGCNNTQQLPVVPSVQNNQVDSLASSKKGEVVYTAHKDPKSKFSQNKTNYTFTKPTIILEVVTKSQYHRGAASDTIKEFIEKFVSKREIKTFEFIYQKDTNLLSVNFYGGSAKFFQETLFPDMKEYLMQRVKINDLYSEYKGETTRLY